MNTEAKGPESGAVMLDVDLASGQLERRTIDSSWIADSPDLAEARIV
jgi:hypothetical protein